MFFAFERALAVDFDRTVIVELNHDTEGSYNTIINETTAFQNGLRFVSQAGISPIIEDDKNKFTYVVSGDGMIQFAVKSLVPTVNIIHTKPEFGSGIIMKSVPKGFSMNFSVPDVLADATPDTHNSTKINHTSNEVLFKPLVNLYLTDREPVGGIFSVSEPLQFSFGVLQKIYTVFTTGTNLVDLPEGVKGFVKAHLSAETLAQKVEIKEDDLVSDYGETDRIESDSFFDFDFVGTHINLKNAGEAQDVSLAFSSKVNYEVIDDLGHTRMVSIAGGNLGSEIEGDDLFSSNISGAVAADFSEAKSIVVGADIEGQVLTKGVNYVFQNKDRDNIVGESRLLRIGGINAVDIREEVTRNAYELTRGVSPEIDYNLTNLDFTNQSIFYFKGGTVKLSGNIKGIGTIIIEDGNLFITDDLVYDDSVRDSLGVILINSAIGTQPVFGNIFVKASIKNIVGTYFADGAFTSTTILESATPAIDDVLDRSDFSVLGTQLLLDGTLFTRNTLGGALLVNPPYLSPWGNISDRLIAQRYDLHFVRRYTPPVNAGVPDLNTATNDKCVPSKEDLMKCDKNNHAFIIRPDGKIRDITPPGFTSS